MRREALFAGVFHPAFSGLADCWASPGVFVVRGHVADAGMKADRVVVLPNAGQFSAQDCRVGDRVQVRVLAFDVAVESLDPGLISRGPWSDEVLGDHAHGHEFGVAPDAICGPLSDTTSSTGRCPPYTMVITPPPTTKAVSYVIHYNTPRPDHRWCPVGYLGERLAGQQAPGTTRTYRVYACTTGTAPACTASTVIPNLAVTRP